MSRPQQTEVVIVGGGPVALLCSCLLSRQGIKHILLEQRANLHQAPQAHVLSARSGQILKSTGISDQALEQVATPAEDLSYISTWVESLAGNVLGSINLHSSKLDAEIEQMLNASPTMMRNISQNRLEPVLLQHAQAQKHAQIRFSQRFEQLHQTDTGVLVDVINNNDLSGNNNYQITCNYVLGADGAGSAVRKACNIKMLGPSCLRHYVSMVIKADLRHLVAQRPGIVTWVMHPAGEGLMISHDIDDTWVLMHPWPIDQEVPPGMHEQWTRAAIGDDSPFEITFKDRWTMSAQVAQHFSSQRVFLVGDAAHRFPPMGGLGLNSGFQDAFNLCWKIAAVLQQQATPKLLNSYQQERQPHVQAICDRSALNFKRMSEVEDALGLTDDASHNIAMLQRLRDKTAAHLQQQFKKIENAIDDQVGHFFLTGFDLGACYSSDIVQAHPQQSATLTADYQPHICAGALLPHAWYTQQQTQVSCLSWLDYSGFTLICSELANEQSRNLSQHYPLSLVVIGEHHWHTQHPLWLGFMGNHEFSAILVRPDGHIAFVALTQRDFQDMETLLQKQLQPLAQEAIAI